MKSLIKNSALSFVFAAFIALSPMIAYAQQHFVYAPLVGLNANGIYMGATIPPQIVPTPTPTNDIPDVAEDTTGYLTLSIDVATQTTLGRAIDFVMKGPTATQDSWLDITEAITPIPSVDQYAVATFTTGVKQKPCVSIKARVVQRTFAVIACYTNADSTNQYTDAITALSAIVNTITNQ